MAKTFAARRVNPRFAFCADAEMDLPDGTSLAGQVFELSVRGCFIDSIKAIPVGTELRLRIWNGMSACEVPAKVIYMQPGDGMAVFGMGVVFENMAAEQQLAIESWIRERIEGTAN
jgi:hypothetical protein